ncbi:MAG: hypothetical protein GX427_09905 [Actinomycetales bacterium]|nr:hypothetical protein [Actinomycetota bacterium]NLI19103.1 hypothetical protein [Actinomycetales bacterium]
MTSLDVPGDVGALVCGALNPVLEPRGFAGGQVNSRGDEVGVVFCSPGSEFRARFASLESEDADGSEAPFCVDVNVYVRAGRLDEARLDGTGLGELLERVGRPDLAAEAAGLDRPACPRSAAPRFAFATLVAVDGGVESVPAAVVGTSSTGPLCEMPLGAALARAAVLLDTVFTAAERSANT